jgi:hypothetical protein
MDWHRHLMIVLGVIGGGLVAIWLFVFAMNPYGNLPKTVLPAHVIMDDNQRFQYPAIVRSHRFDSAVIGTSTARLLDPRSLERIFGGRFANLALNDGRAWEQLRLAELFQSELANPRTLVVGLDWVWCRPDADSVRITRRGFPEWMYDNDPWNDLGYLLNARAVEIAGRRLGKAVGLAKPRWPDDGFEVFTPPESAYDLERARSHIYEGRPAVLPPPYTPAFVPGPADRAEWQFPALAWLQSLTQGRFARGVLVFMPVHAINQPAPDSPSAAMEAECKRQIAAIGKTANWPVIDFRIRSSITTDDTNYWDGLHYRLTIAKRIEDGIARALQTHQDDPIGDWRVLAP